MKIYIKYIVALFIFSVISCQKNADTPEMPSLDGGLISFSTRVRTKAPIITDMYGKHFGVYGYSFSNLTDWETARTRATPNLFHQLDVYCDTDGVCEYSVDTNTDIDGLEQWELNKRYSFFAYFPYINNTTFAPSEISDINIPFINYSLPINNKGNEVDPDALLDVMTAKSLNYSPTRGTIVNFDFYHRLFCIDIHAQNFTSNPANITNLLVTINGIQYNTSKIYMDRDRTILNEDGETILVPSEPGVKDEWNSATSVPFRILNQTETVTVEAKSSNSITGGNNIILIPQNSVESGLYIKINLVKDGESYEVDDTFYADFKEGNKYTLTLNLMGDNVTLVKAVLPTQWDDVTFTHTFE